MHRPHAAEQQPAAQHGTQHAELRRLILRLHGRVWRVPVGHDAPTHKGLALLGDGLAGAFSRLLSHAQWRQLVRCLGAC